MCVKQNENHASSCKDLRNRGGQDLEHVLEERHRLAEALLLAERLGAVEGLARARRQRRLAGARGLGGPAALGRRRPGPLQGGDPVVTAARASGVGAAAAAATAAATATARGPAGPALLAAARHPALRGRLRVAAVRPPAAQLDVLGDRGSSRRRQRRLRLILGLLARRRLVGPVLRRLRQRLSLRRRSLMGLRRLRRLRRLPITIITIITVLLL